MNPWRYNPDPFFSSKSQFLSIEAFIKICDVLRVLKNELGILSWVLFYKTHFAQCFLYGRSLVRGNHGKEDLTCSLSSLCHSKNQIPARRATIRELVPFPINKFNFLIRLRRSYCNRFLRFGTTKPCLRSE